MARDLAQTMDELGYYALWTAEHHFQREGYEVFPNLIQLSLWLATQTSRLKLGCAFNILPMWHPVRLAEDYAMADIVTDGRVIMGVGRGYHTREVESFGAPLLDAEANRELFEEQVEVLLKCFNEEAFSHKGKYYEIPPPVDYRGYRLTRDHLRAAAQASARRDLDAHRQRQDHRLHGPPQLQGHGHPQRREDPRRGRARVPRGLPAPRPPEAARGGRDLGQRASTWPTPRRRPPGAWSPPTTSATSGSRPSASSATPTSRGGPGARRAPRRARRSSRDGIEQKAWFCGPPAHVIEGIKSIEARYPGLEHYMIHFAEGLSPRGVQGTAHAGSPAT